MTKNQIRNELDLIYQESIGIEHKNNIDEILDDMFNCFNSNEMYIFLKHVREERDIDTVQSYSELDEIEDEE